MRMVVQGEGGDSPGRGARCRAQVTAEALLEAKLLWAVPPANGAQHGQGNAGDLARPLERAGGGPLLTLLAYWMVLGGPGWGCTT